MSIYVIGDLHIKPSEPHLKAVRKLFDFLNMVVTKDDSIVQLGDFFDSSSVHHSIVHEFIDRTKKIGKHWYILRGNHDQSVIRGNILLPFDHFDHISVFELEDIVEIEGQKCYMFPYMKNAKEQIENISWTGDYAFFHLTNPEDEFVAGEGINTDNIEAYQFFGHTHTKKRYLTSKGYKKNVVGVPICTRNGEQNNSIYKIINGEVEEIIHNISFAYEDIDYGTFPVSKDNIINVKKVPSVKSVYDMYKDYYIREEGIELLIDETIGEETFSFHAGNIKESFVSYSKEKSIRDELVKKGLEYLL